MPFKLGDVYKNINEIDENTFIDIKVSPKVGKSNTCYIETYYNDNYAKSANPNYLKFLFIEIDKEDLCNYSYLTVGEFAGDNGITKYYSLKFIKTVCPKIIEVMDFIEKCRKNAFLRLRRMYEKERPTPGTAESNVYKCIKDDETFEESYIPLIPTFYKDKKAKIPTRVPVEDPGFSVLFDFSKWGDKMSKQLAGLQKTRIMYEKTEEELAATPESKRHLIYKPVKLDEFANNPKDVIKFNGGQFYGKLIFPGTTYCKDGQIKTKPAIGQAVLIPDPNSDSMKSNPLDLCDEELEVAIESTVNSVRKIRQIQESSDEDDIVETVKSNKKKNDSDDEKKKKKKKPVKKQESSDEEDSSESEPESESDSSDDEKTKKKKSNKKK